MLTFVESPIFSRMVYDYLDDDGYAEFQLFLAANPEAGRVVRASGAVRKIRWARRGAGKSGGIRVEGCDGQHPGPRAQGPEAGVRG
jgi:hypothetical protein